MIFHHLILRVVTKLLVGTIVLFALYVQFHGDFSPGGGFQAGVIMSVAFILYGIVFSLESAKKVFPEWVVHKLLALGVLIYAGTGVATMLLGYDFLDFDESPSSSKHAVFGKVISGYDKVEAISNVSVNSGDRPITDVVIDSIRKIN